MAEDCLFCRIGSGEIPSKKIYEDDTAVAFLDINPRNPGHTLVIPKKHYETIFDIPVEESGELFEVVARVSPAVKDGTSADGLSLSQNNYKAAGQVVPHVHFHLIPRFNNEGPMGVEGLLPVKKMDDKTMDKLAASIKTELGSVPETKPHKKEKKETKEDSDEDISFDF